MSFCCVSQDCTTIFIWQAEEEGSGCSGANERRAKVGERYSLCSTALWAFYTLFCKCHYLKLRLIKVCVFLFVFHCVVSVVYQSERMERVRKHPSSVTGVPHAGYSEVSLLLKFLAVCSETDLFIQHVVQQAYIINMKCSEMLPYLSGRVSIHQ